jgi:hypothetical protein
MYLVSVLFGRNTNPLVTPSVFVGADVMIVIQLILSVLIITFTVLTILFTWPDPCITNAFTLATPFKSICTHAFTSGVTSESSGCQNPRNDT